MAALGCASAGCVTVGGEEGETRLAWLAEQLTLELEAADTAAMESSRARLTLLTDALSRPELGFSGDLSAAALEPVEPAMTLPEPVELASAVSAQLAPLVTPTLAAGPSEPVGLALGRFADAGLARSLWGELAALDSVALMGLEAHLVANPGGDVTLLAGPLPGEAEAAERCSMIATFGVACAAQALPQSATRLAAAGGAP